MAKKWKVIAYEKEKERELQESREAQTREHELRSSPKLKVATHYKLNSVSSGKGLHPATGQGVGNPWGPSSPTEGATAPSPPPSWLPTPTAGKVTVCFNGMFNHSSAN